MSWFLFLSLHAFSQQTLDIPPPSHFISNPQVQQCVAALPTIGWLGFDHTWLAYQEQSFGMPYSYTQNAIQGGYATIRTPDPSLPNLTSDPVCKAIYQPESIAVKTFTEKFLCLVSKFSDRQDVIAPDWQPVFVYNWSSSNCHLAVRFMLDCAGGVMSLNPNGGLGSSYSEDEILNVWKKNLNNSADPESASYQKLFLNFISDLESLNQTHGDIPTFLNEKSPILLSQLESLLKSLENTQDLRRTGLYRRLQKLNFNLKKIIPLMQRSFDTTLLQELRNLQEIFRQPDVVKKTYQQICEQAQKECS